MHNEPGQKKKFVFSILPWLIAVAALIFYLPTFNTWMSLHNLIQVAKSCGWTWGPEIYSPLYFLLTYPTHWLPAQWVPLVLNIFSLGCAVLTLALLARSVVLLPHDRTESQRQRESSRSGLSIRAAWLPPVIAAIVLGLQLSFWESATSGATDMLDLLVMAYVIRNLLEFRVARKDSWLLRAALVCGAGAANGWLMFCLLPVFLIALVWIKGLAFFNLRFLVQMALCGMAGMLLYLLLPLVYVSSADATGSFWQILKLNLSVERGMLTNLSHMPSNVMLLLFMPSFLPILVIGIRWASNFGDPSRMGSWIATWIFHLAHSALLVVCVWVAFDPDFGARHRGYPFLALYYLGALSVGYLSGYFLLVFEPLPDHMGRVSALQTKLHWASQAAVWLLLFLIPAGLIYKNSPQLKIASGGALKDYSALLIRNLPREGIVLSDSEESRYNISRKLFLAQAYLAGASKETNYVFVDTQLLKVPSYHALQRDLHPGIWPLEVDVKSTAAVEDPVLFNLLTGLSEKHSVSYLHPSFGYYFESFYQRPQGLSLTLKSYPTNSLSGPPLTEAEIASNEEFWNSNREAMERLKPFIAPPPPGPKPSLKDKLLKKLHISFEPNATAVILGRFYSQALNYWGVEVQRAGKLHEAEGHFQTALAMNPQNFAAKANLELNRELQAGKTLTLRIPRNLEDELGKFRSLQEALRETGPFDDPMHCFGQAMVFAAGNLPRQSAQQFERVHTLVPDNLAVRVLLAKLYIANRFPNKALGLIDGIHLRPEEMAAAGISSIDLLQTEVMALYSDQRQEAAAQRLQTAVKENPTDLNLLAGIIQLSSTLRLYTNALIAIDQQLQVNSNDVATLVNKGFYNMQLGHFEDAIPPLTQAMALQTNNHNAQLYRAVACLSCDRLKEAKHDYDCLQKSFPNSIEVNSGLAEIAWRMNETNAAIRHYQLCLPLVAPDSEQAKAIKERLKVLKSE